MNRDQPAFSSSHDDQPYQKCGFKHSCPHILAGNFRLTLIINRCTPTAVLKWPKWHFYIRNLTFCIKWWLQLSKNVISIIWLFVLFSFKYFRITCCLNNNSKSSSDRLTAVTLWQCHSSRSDSKLMMFNSINERPSL